jgi:hypothetical protein
VTKAGSKLLLDDDGSTITISDDSQNEVKLDSGGVTLTRGGNKVEVGDSEVSVNDGALEVM